MSDFFDGVEALTFDCYGTIVDWETGIVRALRLLLGDEAASPSDPDADDDEPPPTDEELLALYGRLEPEAQQGPFRPYRSVLEEVANRFGEVLATPVHGEAARRFAASVGRWPAFPDSREALAALGRRYRLAIVSNVDDDLFAETARHLGIDFEEVVTAQQVRSYKPGVAHFEEVLHRLALPKERVVHVAQSLYHDIAPAGSLGLRCVWVDRRSGRAGGATPPAEATPDLTVPDLATLAREARA